MRLWLFENVISLERKGRENNMIILKKVCHNNWLDCIELEVEENQKQFVNPNIFSLAEAYVHSSINKKEANEYYRCIPLAIYNDELLIGFTMITFEQEHDFDGGPAYEIYRLMIDKKYQKKGYGTEALNKIIEYIKTFPCGKAENIFAEWHPLNTVIESVCKKFGFEVVGRDEEDGAIISKFNIGIKGKQL